MAYLAIARKYRPETFADMVGQEHVTRTLTHAIERGRVHHAYLFCGARGVGKTTTARSLARALNCKAGPTPTPCGHCVSCESIAKGSSPDLIEIDGASNNSVDDVRELRESVRYAPTQGGWKIYLIDEVHMLSKGAFNALLKTLEEPPPHVAFIFATTEPQKIPETILSRVQRFDFKRIPVTAVAQRLAGIAEREGATVSEAALRTIARAGEGSMRDAESLLDQVIAAGGASVSDDEVHEILGLIDRGLLYEMLTGLVQGEPARCLEVIDKVYSYGYEIGQFTNEMLEVLRNAAFIRLSESAVRYIDVPAAELELLRTATEGVDPEALSRTFNALLDVHEQLTRASRPRIVLEMAIARLAAVRPAPPVSALLSRLETLERELRHAGARAKPKGSRGPPASMAPREPHRRMPASRPVTPPPRAEPAPAPKPQAAPQAAPRAAPQARTTAPPPRVPEPAPPPPEATPAPPTRTPWQKLQRALEGMGVAGQRLAEATVQTTGDGIVLEVDNLRRQVEGRKLVAGAAADAVAAAFPDQQVVVQVRQIVSDDPAARLKQAVLSDPDFRRVIECLDARVDSVTPLGEE